MSQRKTLQPNRQKGSPMKENTLKTIRIQPEICLEKFKTFVREEVIPRSAEYDEKGEFDHRITKRLHELGLLTPITPVEHGGLNLPVQDLVWIARTLAYGSSGVSATFIGNLLGYSAIVLYAQPELKKRLCEKMHREFGLWSFGMTEKGCGSDLEKTATKAVKTKNGYVLNGEKNFITNASYATDISIFAQTFSESGEVLGISCFYVPGNSKGLTRGAGEKKLGWRESNTGHLYLKDVEIPASHLLGVEGKGLKILTHCLNRSKTLLGAVSVGICDRALDLTLERLGGTDRFDRPLLTKHSIRHVISRLSVKVECAWLLACQAAATWDNNAYAVREASMSKLFGGATATQVTGKCVELFGARGFLSSFEISRLYRDSKAIEIVEGPTLVQELLISKFACDNSYTSSSNKYNPQEGPSPEKDKAA